MTDDLTLIDGDSLLVYRAPEGGEWGKQKFSREVLERARVVNERFLEKKLRNGLYGEVYLTTGKQCAAAIPDLTKYGVKVFFQPAVDQDQKHKH